jgi:hypothetical protein
MRLGGRGRRILRGYVIFVIGGLGTTDLLRDDHFDGLLVYIEDKYQFSKFAVEEGMVGAIAGVNSVWETELQRVHSRHSDLQKVC